MRGCSCDESESALDLSNIFLPSMFLAKINSCASAYWFAIKNYRPTRCFYVCKLFFPDRNSQIVL
ncbi:MAG: hypothetical protein CVU11_00595 [Bacteroidetes bacterium HGW-Bacteroidetes-6]|nr:MAG: hypothetical protein CVU11_00595 [Bacteroidetes bacterium HGW-Bacteroidetes-6]